MEQATLGGGCFWCLDAYYRRIKGVVSVETGYSGGHVDSPTMRRVYDGDTGHAEVVQVTFDPGQITYREILEIFFIMHDPTTLNRQGNDVGDEYRSVIFYHSAEQMQTAENMKDQFAADLFQDPIVTEITPIVKFWPADLANQDFFAKNPYSGYCMVVIDPKIAKLRQKFAERFVEAT